MRVNLGKAWISATDDLTATHPNVRHSTWRVEGLEHRLFVDNILSSQRLFDDLEKRKINSCRTIRTARKDTPPLPTMDQENKLKRGVARVRTTGNLTALTWKNRREVYILNTMDLAPPEGNCDHSNLPVKPHIMARRVCRQFWLHGWNLLDQSTCTTKLFPPSGSDCSKELLYMFAQ